MTDHSSLLDSLAKPPPPPSELDELMSRDPLSLSAADIDSIIAYERQFRARKAAGEIKTTRGRKAADAPSGIDLVALVKGVPGAIASAPAPTVTPAKPGSFRRI